MNRKSLALAAITAGFALMFAPAAAANAAGTVYEQGGVIYAADGTRLTDDEVNSDPAVSPNGKHIAYVHNETVWVMDADGTDAHQISDRVGSNPVWAGNGKTVTYTAESCTGEAGTFRTGLTGGTTNTVVAPASCRNQPAPQMGSING